MLECELESEFLSLLEVLRRSDPTVVPGSQQERSRDVPAKLVTGAYLNRLHNSGDRFNVKPCVSWPFLRPG